MAYSLAELRTLTEAELVARHDDLAKQTQPGISYYLEKLARRDSDRTNQRMTKLTEDIHRMTIAITMMTFLALLATIVSIFR